MLRIRYPKKHSLGFHDVSEITYVGSTNGYAVYFTNDEPSPGLQTYWFHDPDFTDKQGAMRVVAEMTLRQSKNGVYEVDVIVIDSEYQGLDLAPKMYAYILRKLNITLQAGECQSPGGRSIWRRLSRRKDVLIYGKTPHGKPIMLAEDPITAELAPVVPRSNIELYDGYKDFYMYAVRAA